MHMTRFCVTITMIRSTTEEKEYDRIIVCAWLNIMVLPTRLARLDVLANDRGILCGILLELSLTVDKFRNSC